ERPPLTVLHCTPPRNCPARSVAAPVAISSTISFPRSSRRSYDRVRWSMRVDDDEASRSDRLLDEALEETFPASDPPANTVETGIRLDAHALWREVIDNREASRFELTLDGALSVLEYERLRQSLVLLHTEVAPALRGRHIADALAKAAIESAHAA